MGLDHYEAFNYNATLGVYFHGLDQNLLNSNKEKIKFSTNKYSLFVKITRTGSVSQKVFLIG